MPTSGPNYFSTGNTSSSSGWIPPQNAENAPDGNYVNWNGAASNVWLYMFDWQGTLPANKFYDFPNFVIEIYGYSSTGQIIPFRTQIITRADGLLFGGISSDKNVNILGTNSWLNISNTNWSIPYPLTTNTSVGVAISADVSSAFLFYIDSVRMTVSYNDNDGFYFPGYGPGKRKRRFINKKGKVIAQTRVR